MYDNYGGGAGGQSPRNRGIDTFASLLALGTAIIITPWVWGHLGSVLNPFILEQYGGDWADYVSGFINILLYPLLWAALKASIALLFTTIMVYGATRLPMLSGI
jgi:hypothetical protein